MTLIRSLAVLCSSILILSPAWGQSDFILLSDSQIAKIMQDANLGEVVLGEIADDRAEHWRVEDFAEQMVEEHSRANTNLSRVTARKGIGLLESSISLSLQDHVANTRELLLTLTGRDFDIAYIEDQIYTHQRVLDILDTHLLPQVRDTDLRAYLMTARAAVAMHLEEAQLIRSILADKSAVGD